MYILQTDKWNWVNKFHGNSLDTMAIHNINVITMYDEIDALSLKLTSCGQLLYKHRIAFNNTELGNQNKDHKKMDYNKYDWVDAE